MLLIIFEARPDAAVQIASLAGSRGCLGVLFGWFEVLQLLVIWDGHCQIGAPTEIHQRVNRSMLIDFKAVQPVASSENHHSKDAGCFEEQ